MNEGLSPWWIAIALWLFACVIVLMWNHGAHKDDEKEDGTP